MGLHSNTVFKNSCLKVPLDPVNKLPIASYERKLEREYDKGKSLQNLDLVLADRKDTLSLKDFYKSIPDYKDLTHLSNHEFYLKLENLRENKLKLLLNIDRNASPSNRTPKIVCDDNSMFLMNRDMCDNVLEKYVSESDHDSLLSENYKKMTKPIRKNTSPLSPKKPTKMSSPTNSGYSHNGLNSPTKLNLSNDSPFFNDGFSKKSLSVPSSPVKKLYSPQFSIMSKRDTDKNTILQLREYSKDLEYSFLDKNKTRKQFKANPVPIESRIPLFDKIMEDQELRRAISKLQSTADLQAQMKPFSFTEREEKQGSFNKMGCSRLYKSNPQLNIVSPSFENEFIKQKRFRARPVPKSLFSNYVYEKMKEDDFYRALNRKIRAEELLKTASLPPSMEMRKKSGSKCRSSCQKYHNFRDDLSEESNSNKNKKKKTRNRKKEKYNARNAMVELDISQFDNFHNEKRIAKRKDKSQDDILKAIYGSTSGDTVTPSSGYVTRPHSDNDTSAINKSNLAAVLRIESTKKKLEADILRQLEEERFQSEMKWRDSVLRRNPAWKSLKYSQTDDFSIRLQMRRDEERLRREQFLHEMELMYGRVHSQPMMFERSYGPNKPIKNIPSKHKDGLHKPRSSISKQYMANSLSPTRSRKVSINETAETINDDIEDYLYKKYDDDVFSKSSDDVPEDITKHYLDKDD